MTKLLNLIVASAIETLEQAPNVCDEVLVWKRDKEVAHGRRTHELETVREV